MSGFAGLLMTAALAVIPPADPALATAFQRSVSAVLDLGTPNARVVIIDRVAGADQRRTLKIGDVYSDGWRLAAVSAGEVVLDRKGDRRAIPLLSAAEIAALPPGPSAEAGVLPGSVDLSNSQAGGSAKARSPAVAKAVAAGDARAVLAAGGSPQDAAAAIGVLTANAVGRPRLPAFLALFEDTSDGSTFRQGDVNGRPGLIRSSPDGGFMNLSLDGVYAIVGGGAVGDAIGAIPSDGQTYVPPPVFNDGGGLQPDGTFIIRQPAPPG